MGLRPDVDRFGVITGAVEDARADTLDTGLFFSSSVLVTSASVSDDPLYEDWSVRRQEGAQSTREPAVITIIPQLLRKSHLTNTLNLLKLYTRFVRNGLRTKDD